MKECVPTGILKSPELFCVVLSPGLWRESCNLWLTHCLVAGFLSHELEDNRLMHAALVSLAGLGRENLS